MAGDYCALQAIKHLNSVLKKMTPPTGSCRVGVFDTENHISEYKVQRYTDGTNIVIARDATDANALLNLIGHEEWDDSYFEPVGDPICDHFPKVVRLDSSSVFDATDLPKDARPHLNNLGHKGSMMSWEVEALKSVLEKHYWILQGQISYCRVDFNQTPFSLSVSDMKYLAERLVDSYSIKMFLCQLA